MKKDNFENTNAPNEQLRSMKLLDDRGEKTEFKALIDDMDLTPLAVEEIKQIRGGGKAFREFLIKIESGGEGEIGFIRNDSSPLDYWCLTTTPEEVNARRRTFELVEHILGTDQTFNYLAQKYPFGLPDGEEFDETELVNFVAQTEAEDLRTVKLADQQQTAEQMRADGEKQEQALKTWLEKGETKSNSDEPPASSARKEVNNGNDKQTREKAAENKESVFVLSPFDDLYGEK